MSCNPPAPQHPQAVPTAHPPAGGRLPALDALRGFDMFWLIGGEQLPAALWTWRQLVEHVAGPAQQPAGAVGVAAIMADPEFAKGGVDTNYLGGLLPRLAGGCP